MTGVRADLTTASQDEIILVRLGKCNRINSRKGSLMK
jgi:hypothetical protein